MRLETVEARLSDVRLETIETMLSDAGCEYKLGASRRFVPSNRYDIDKVPSLYFTSSFKPLVEWKEHSSVASLDIIWFDTKRDKVFRLVADSRGQSTWSPDPLYPRYVIGSEGTVIGKIEGTSVSEEVAKLRDSVEVVPYSELIRSLKSQ